MNIENLKKIKEIYDVNDYEVFTDVGFIDIKSIIETIEYNVYKIKVGDEYIECADKHIFIDEFDNEVFAIDSLGKNIKINGKIEKCKLVEKLPYSQKMYDLELKKHHKYYVNNILSHNTTVVAGFILHQAIFNRKHRIACLANKLEQAQEILDRIKDSYAGLPWFLQMGVKVWNQKRIELGNETIVYVSGTTPDAVRGKSINCFSKNNIITIENKENKNIELVTFEELANKLK